jgi:putative DNA primase/helicase
MLHGDGRNGKGTLLRVIEVFLGRVNCSNRSLQDLDNNRFAVADLFGKIANILADSIINILSKRTFGPNTVSSNIINAKSPDNPSKIQVRRIILVDR